MYTFISLSVSEHLMYMTSPTLSCAQEIKWDFSLVNLSVVDLIIRLSRRTRGRKGDFFSLPHTIIPFYVWENSDWDFHSPQIIQPLINKNESKSMWPYRLVYNLFTMLHDPMLPVPRIYGFSDIPSLNCYTHGLCVLSIKIFSWLVIPLTCVSFPPLWTELFPGPSPSCLSQFALVN